MKIYLASRFIQRPQMITVGNILKMLGHDITASWVYGGEEGMSREQIAVLDLKDVDACDILVSFTLPPGTPFKSGGRHVEFGYALAKGKRCILIGERENVFHHFPGVEVYRDMSEWLTVERAKTNLTTYKNALGMLD